MAASTGVAPASLGLKNRDPELLDDKAVKPGGGQNPLTSVGRTAPAEFAGITPPAAARSANSAERAFFHKEHTPSPLSPACKRGRIGRPRDLARTQADSTGLSGEATEVL